MIETAVIDKSYTVIEHADNDNKTKKLIGSTIIVHNVYQCKSGIMVLGESDTDFAIFTKNELQELV